jgi:tetratricopeptide (TPR) repeat protein
MTKYFNYGEALYEQGLYFLYEMEDAEVALELFLGAASAGYKPAYGEIGVISSSHKNDPDRAENWFKRISDITHFSLVALYEYGRLLYDVRDDWEAALPYFLAAANLGHEPANQYVAVIRYEYTGEIDEARKCFECAKVMGHLSGYPASSYADFLDLEMGDYEQAEYYRKKTKQDLHDLNLNKLQYA